ncbi:LPXTG cell wall anchor domain-containing protein [Enterococcus faecalis]|uniref:LPXTG cell wall anchor domain-containing protein n=1 Tax=Enterococcus faecalis TaxID=1351 RepID=UPI0021DFADD5|nr:LPXTG cell wall anchor domain-containing protein [Enterococcus faecalis]MCU9780993.1 LPXTG cell wall anchor domain-containing protein [Enterococcus faecalis]MDN3128875.1 LPXTG cell wall anchor domain-containing protein [Enterococcus faecalis]HCW2669461.1 LPXTG cell wall anchor domain-containing protein [Enterococcus faecalis]
MRKKRITTYLAMTLVVVGLASTSTSISAVAETSNPNQANTEVAVTLTRKVTPSELPGSNGGASNTPTSSQTKGSVGALPYTGTTQNYWWGLVGSVLVTLALSIKFFGQKLRKED